MWHYPKNASLTFEAEGKRIFDIRCKSDVDLSKENKAKCLQNGLQQDSPSDESYDAMHFDLPFGVVQQLANAKDVSVKIDKVSFAFSDENIATLKTFIDKIQSR